MLAFYKTDWKERSGLSGWSSFSHIAYKVLNVNEALEAVQYQQTGMPRPFLAFLCHWYSLNMGAEREMSDKSMNYLYFRVRSAQLKHTRSFGNEDVPESNTDGLVKKLAT